MIEKHAQVSWSGTGKDGQGAISTESRVLQDAPYGMKARFEGGKGTNPEELIGAAHAGCFTMALAFKLSEAGFQPKDLKTKATVTLDKEGAGWAIKESRLNLTAVIPEITDAKFQELAQDAKANCPVSKIINAKISLEAKLTHA